MTSSSITSEITKLVITLAKNKEDKIKQYKRRMLLLKKEKEQNPEDFIKKNKYILAKMRYEQLKKTTHELWQLEQKMEELKGLSDKFVSVKIINHNHYDNQHQK